MHYKQVYATRYRYETSVQMCALPIFTIYSRCRINSDDVDDECIAFPSCNGIAVRPGIAIRIVFPPDGNDPKRVCGILVGFTTVKEVHRCRRLYDLRRRADAWNPKRIAMDSRIDAAGGVHHLSLLRDKLRLVLRPLGGIGCSRLEPRLSSCVEFRSVGIVVNDCLAVRALRYGYVVSKSQLKAISPIAC